MERIEVLLDLLDSWDEMNDSIRVSPEVFCKDHPELLDDFTKVLQQRGVLTAILNGQDSPALDPDSMIERLQSGRFPVVKFHDKGGLGWVYIARDRELGRTVALKCLQPDPATDPVACQRFVREAEITARLEHPGIVPIYGMGSYGIGDASKAESPSYAMRFVQGETLRDTIRELHATYEKIDWRSIEGTRILRSFVTVCETVAFAHSRHVIHRDLKSANIMLGAYGETLVLDWGLAKLQDEAPGDSITQEPRSGLALDYNATQTGVTLGTIGFMSPEQARGDWENVNSASDIFSLGAILYQILTNQAPYQGDEALRAARTCSYQPPQAIASSVPKPLAAVCMKAMRDDPSERYVSAIDLRNDIERYLADEPVSARQDSIYERLQRTLRRHRVAVQMGGLMALLAVVMLSTFLNFAAKKNDELKTAYDNEASAKDEAILQSHRVQKALLASVRENYAANMAQVAQSLSARQPARLADMLIKAGSRIGSPIDPRGIEWWMSWNKAYGGVKPIPLNSTGLFAMRLIDSGNKAIFWTRSDELVLIDLQTNAELFRMDDWNGSTDSLAFEFSPGELPCSEDGSTIAISDHTSRIQIYTLDKASTKYVLSRTLDVGDHVSAVTFSHDGRVLVAGDVSGLVHCVDLKSERTQRFDIGEHRAINLLNLSSDGRFLAYFKSIVEGGLPAVLDLTQGTSVSASGDMMGTFNRVAFGQYGTLLAWNSERVVTFANMPSSPLKPLWETNLSQVIDLTKIVNPIQSIREWIVLSKEGEGLSPELISEGLQIGAIDDIVRATTLAIRLPRPPSVLAGPLGYRVFYRDDKRDFSGKRLANQTRYTEIVNPNLKSIVDFSSDGRTALVKSDSSNDYSILSGTMWLLECIDRSDSFQPITKLAWTDDFQLLSMQQRHLSYKATSTEIDRYQTPFDPNAIVSRETISLIDSANPSGDLSVVANYHNNQVEVQSLDDASKQFTFTYETKMRSFINDNVLVRVFPWGKRNVGTREPIGRVWSPSDGPPLNLPWVLCVPRFEITYDKGDWIEPDRTDQKNRFLIVDYEKSEVVHELNVYDNAVTAASISENGRGIALVSRNRGFTAFDSHAPQLHTWSVNDDRSISKGRVIEVKVDARCVVMNPSGTHAAIGATDGKVLVVELSSGSIVMQTDAHEAPVRAIAFSPDGTRLVSAGEDVTVRFYSTFDWNEVMRFNCQSIPTCLAFDHRSRSLAVGDEAGHIEILSAATGKDVLDLAALWLKQESTAAAGEDAILRELWAEFVTSHGRPEDEIEAGLETLESLRGKVRELSIDELRQRFLIALPPFVETLGIGARTVPERFVPP